MKNYDEIVADSSFYICFLDDINRPEILLRIINEFNFIVTPLIKKEIEKSKNYAYISENQNILYSNSSLDYGEIIKPFFAQEEIIRGEHEVIGAAYFLYKLNKLFCFILDDKEPRKFVVYNIPDLAKLMVGTVNFVGLCCCSYKLLKKEEAILLLNQIKKSKFRIEENIINQAEIYIKRCKNDS